MIDAAALKDLLHRADLSSRDKVLLVLAADGAKPKSTAEIKRLAVAAGLRRARDWRISIVLSRGGGGAIWLGAAWELNRVGKARVTEITGTGAPTAASAAQELTTAASAIRDPDSATFVLEAIGCLQARLLRAAVVLSWVGAVALLYGYVVSNALAAFNQEAKRRDSGWRNAKTADDLARMKEHEFLNVLEAISVLGKNVKQELQQCLTLRNACGHPNSLALGEARVYAHIETLILNVFQRF